jgi:hypothetical protein
MTQKLVLFVLALTLPLSAVAQGGQRYRCTSGDLLRRVEIFYETGVAVPCEVHYFKDTEAPGEREVLWRALNESGYCESRTESFIAQLRSRGWECSFPVADQDGADQDDAASDDVAQDDTDTLGAGQPEP